jgi:hypothetical protein
MKTAYTDKVAPPPPTPTPPPARPEAGGAEERESLLDWVRAWDRFWFSPADPTTLGLIRVCAGAVALYVHLCYSFLLLSYVGPNGWIDTDAARYMRREVPIRFPGFDWEDTGAVSEKGQYYWSIYFHVQDPVWICVIHAGVVVVMFLFTIGFCTRVTSVLAWLGAMSYIQRAPSLLFGMDTMMMIVLLYLMIGPSGAALSVDRWLQLRRERRRRPPHTPSAPRRQEAVAPAPLVSANFAIRLIQVHFCIIYLASGTSKLLGSSWWSGTALNLVVLNYSFAPFGVGLYYHTIAFLTQYRWLWEILMTGGVVFTFFTEIGLPFLIWNRRTRWLMMCCSALLHTGIGLFMGLTTFSLMMLVMLLSFVPPDVVRRVLTSCGDRARALLAARARRGAASGKPDSLVLAR